MTTASTATRTRTRWVTTWDAITTGRMRPAGLKLVMLMGGAIARVMFSKCPDLECSTGADRCFRGACFSRRFRWWWTRQTKSTPLKWRKVSKISKVAELIARPLCNKCFPFWPLAVVVIWCAILSRYATIMSYANDDCGGVSKINYFSNPDIGYLGLPTGTLTDDNARCIEDNMVRLVTVGYRQPRRRLAARPRPTSFRSTRGTSIG